MVFCLGTGMVCVFMMMVKESKQEGTNAVHFFRMMVESLSRPIDFLFLLCLIQFTMRLMKLIGKTELGSLVIRGGCWNSPVWVIVWEYNVMNLSDVIDA